MAERSSLRVLVTGAAGFIGYHQAERFIAENAIVHGIDNLNEYYDVELKHARLSRLLARERFTFDKVDVADMAAVGRVFATFRPDVCIHLAAQAGVRYSLENPGVYIDSNVSGFLSVLEACRFHPVKHLVYASSSSVYGANAQVPFSEHDIADHPLSLYAASKRANELMAHAYAHLFGIRATGLRFFTVYGPWGRPDMAYFKFTKAISEGSVIDLYNYGDMSRDFTYVDDVTTAICRLAGRPPSPAQDFDNARPDPARGAVPHRIYNVGNHSPMALSDLVAFIEQALGKTARTRLMPMQPGDVPATFADVRDLAAAVGFAPSTHLEHGIARFVAWYQSFYPESSVDQARHEPGPRERPGVAGPAQRPMLT